MEFSYQQNNSGQFFPVIPLKIFRGKKFLPTIALVDSGATISIFRPDIAKYLGIEIETGKEIFLGGVGGRIKGYVHNLETIVGNKKLLLPMVFSSEYHVSFNLLGRNTFFNNFRIIFDEKNKKIKLE